jgi:phospholipid/cholesterol/gamma-HCH transport system permease protein
MIKDIKELFSLFAKVFKVALKGPYRFSEIVQITGFFAFGSMPIVLIATIFAVIVVTAEIALHMEMALQTVSMVPGVTGQFIFREIAIIIPSLLLVAKTGAGIAAEVSSMKVTEQIDALKLLRIDPIEYLVFPRMIASIISTVCLTMMSLLLSIASAMAYSKINFGVQQMEYILLLKPYLGQMDLICSICKSAVFGAVVPVIACFYGFQCKGGADGVGKSTTESVVTSTVVVIVLDFVLTYLFSLLI